MTTNIVINATLCDPSAREQAPMASDSDKRRELESEIEKTDQKIDRLVYQLYGLTDKEREIIKDTQIEHSPTPVHPVDVSLTSVNDTK